MTLIITTTKPMQYPSKTIHMGLKMMTMITTMVTAMVKIMVMKTQQWTKNLTGYY